MTTLPPDFKKDMNEKITMVMTSISGNDEWINRSLKSSKWFDEILLFIDPNSPKIPSIDLENIKPPVRMIEHSEHIEIGPALDLLIKNADDGWICAFYDDDYFYPDELKRLVDLIKFNNIEEDIVHFQCSVEGPEHPKEIWGSSRVSEDLFRIDNQIPGACFFRKKVWDAVGGFRGKITHDWIFWFRALRIGFKFRFFDSIIYNFTYRYDSAFHQQMKKYADGSFEKTKQHVFAEVFA